MSVVAEAEQVYSVDVEMADGTRTVVQVRGETAGDAFRQARDTPGVRRVGRVTAGSRPGGTRGPVGGRSASAAKPGTSGAQAASAPEPPPPAAHRGQLLGLSISGPRLVRDARPAGGERPFAHLQPPPPRPEPVHPPRPTATVKPPKPAAPARPAAAEAVPVNGSIPAASVPVQPSVGSVVAAQPAPSPSTAADREYRIVKSRRKDGLPYLLQRGTWGQHGSKRIFDSTWEKGFDTREKAEHHQAWAERMAAEIAEFNRDLAEAGAE